MASSFNRSGLSRLSNSTHKSPFKAKSPFKSPSKFDSAAETESQTSESEESDFESAPIPDINKRLGYLRPSRELLEYYRKKIADYDAEQEETIAKLDGYKDSCEDQHKIQWELRQREEEIAELQKALSDMQIYLFQEREHVLRLYAENDRLKIRELDDRKKIQHLLALNGATESEITYFLKEPPAKAIIPQHLPKKNPDKQEKFERVARSSGKKDAGSGSTPECDRYDRYKRDNQTLVLQIEALQSQLEEQTRLAREQAEALMDDRRVKMEEMEARRERDNEKIKTLTEKLKKTQDLLYDSTKDFLELRYEGRSHERTWMAEKDQLLRELDVCKQQLNISKDNVLDVTEGAAIQQNQRFAEDIKSLEYQLKQSQKVGDMYREQVISLEDELSRIREEGDVNREIFKDRSDKMGKRLQLMNARYTDLEKRRNLEVEGFKTDIKHLRGRLRQVEKQLYKVTVGLGEGLDDARPDDLDMHILRNVRQTAGRSKQLMGDLKMLKTKMYSLENDLRHL